MVNRKIIQGYIAGSLAAIIWGIQPIIIRMLISNEVNTFNIAFVKVLGSACVLGIATIISRKWIQTPQEKPKINIYFILAVLALFGNIFTYHWGLNYTFASDVMIIETLSPLFVVLFGVLLLRKRFQDVIKNKKLSTLFLLIAFGSIGSTLLIFDPNQTAISSHSRNIGDIIVTIASITFALYLLMSSEVRRLSKTLPHELMFYFFLGTSILLLPFIDIGNFGTWTQHQWLLVSLISIVFTALPLLLWNIASGIIEAAPLSILFNIAAIVTIITEMLFLDLRFSWGVVLATLIIIFTAYQAKRIMDESRDN